MRKVLAVGVTVLALGLMLASCEQKESESREGKTKLKVTKESWGKNNDGKEVELYTLVNHSGMKAKIMTQGAILTALDVPDKNGKLTDVTLGFDTVDGYLKP